MQEKSHRYGTVLAIILIVSFVSLSSCAHRKMASAPPPETRKHDRLVLNLSFDADQATLKADDYEKLNAAIDFIKRFKNSSIIIEGHTDNVGSKDYNHDLSHKRADAVKNYLTVHGGIPEEKMKTIGYGESRPVASNDTQEGKEQNRRVELLISSDK